MKNNVLLNVLLVATLLAQRPAQAQPGQTPQAASQDGTKSEDKGKVLSDISKTLDDATKKNEQTAALLTTQAANLTTAIRRATDADEKADLLTQRISVLEKKQETLDKNELLVYQANYQAAMVNLVSMDKEIKPLKLFNATKRFFVGLNDTGNPTKYAGYDEFLTSFKEYLGREKEKEASLEVVNSLLALTGDLTKGVPFSGPVATTVISSAATFVATLGSKKKDVRQKGDKMLLITAKTAQFTHDKELIEDQQESLEKELDSLQKQYREIAKYNLGTLSIPEAVVENRFLNEQDGDKRYSYLTELRQIASTYVATIRANTTTNPNVANSEWKNSVYRQMVGVQQLKIRFGLILVRMQDNLNQYQKLIDKYKADPDLGPRVSGLEVALREVKADFEDVFSPATYVAAAQDMYKVM